MRLKKTKKPQPERWGLFRKGYWSPIIIVYSKEEAERLLNDDPKHKDICEIRKIID